MDRVSTNMANNDMQYYMQQRSTQMTELQNKMAEQTRIHNLRDDPVSAAHSVRYLSNIKRMERYSRNIDTVLGENRVAEGYMKSANDILHRIRELAVQGGNDTYTKDEKMIMGNEVNELLNELVSIANAKTPDGTSMFAGDRTRSDAYRILTGDVPGSSGNVITAVEYRGSINGNDIEISDGSFIESGFPGNQVFWAEQQQIISDKDAQNYVAANDTSIRIDNAVIEINSGDNIYAIISKINNSDAAVKASLDPVKNSLVLETTTPHEIWMEDSNGGTVLQDLGMVSGKGRPPYNVNRDAIKGGGSLFDMIINIRDQLYEGNTLNIGGSGLKGITIAQNNLIGQIARLGSTEERLKTVQDRLAYEIPEVQERNSKETDIDMTKAITDLKMLEYTHKAALQTAGRILQPTLLDFLR